MKKLLTAVFLIKSLTIQSQLEFIIGVYNEKIVLDSFAINHTSSQINGFTNENKDLSINFIAGWSQFETGNSAPSDTYNFHTYRKIIDSFYKPNQYYPIFCLSNRRFTYASQTLASVYIGNALDSIITKYTSKMKSYSSWFNLGDEPLKNDAIDYVLSVNRKIKKASINNKTYVTLVGIDPSDFDSTKIMNPLFPPYLTSITRKSCDKYKNYLKRFKKTAIDSPQIDFIAFDYYPHAWKPLSGGNYDTENYTFYSTLKSMQDVFGREFVSYISSRNADNIAIPNEAQLRHSIFSSIAYGVKGIAYWQTLPEGDSTNSKIIKKTNKYLKDIIGPIAANYSRCITLHKSYNSSIYDDPNKTISNYNASNNDFIINDVSHVNLIVTQFETNDDLNLIKGYLENDNKYILFTNKSTVSTMSNVTVSLKGDLTNRVYLAPRIANYQATQANSKDYSKIATTSATFSGNLASNILINEILPGEGILIKIVPIVTPCPADYDGDGNTDLAVKSSTGQWRINYGVNGYSLGWDIAYNGWEGPEFIPVPADYDGDGKADLSTKNKYGGWYFDYSWNGINGIDEIHWGYGNENNIPVPADYDGDGKVDIGIKSSINGTWSINLMKNSFSTGYDSVFYGYGDANSIPVPADYDGDGKADLSCKTNNTYYFPDGSFSHKGEWRINFAKNGFLGGFEKIATWVGGTEAIPCPADYDGDGKNDLAVKSNYDGKCYINLASDGFNDGWNLTASANNIPIDFKGEDYYPYPKKYYGTNVKYCSFSKENIWTIFGSNAIWYQGKLSANNEQIDSMKIKFNNSIDVSIFPNPTDGLLNITFKTFEEDKLHKVNIYSANGIKLISQSLSTKTSLLNLYNIASGNYFMEILSGKDIVHKKITLNR